VLLYDTRRYGMEHPLKSARIAGIFKKKKRSGLERFFIISNEIRILFCFCNDFFESVEILDSDFRKHLSVDLDVCFIKKTDKLAV